MSERVHRTEIQTGRWYVIRQGSVLRPMHLVGWASATTAIMRTRQGSERQVSILSIVEGWDPGRGQKEILLKSGEPDLAAFEPVPPAPKPKRAKRIHQNSYKSWRELDSSSRAGQVCGVLYSRGASTDREVCEALGSADMNHARPSITALVQDGVVVEVGTTTCLTTGRRVRVVDLAKRGATV